VPAVQPGSQNRSFFGWQSRPQPKAKGWCFLDDLFREPATPPGHISAQQPMNHPGPSDELLKLLENLPPDEPRPKLEPFPAIVLRCCRQGRSYRRIQEILREQCQIEVAYQSLRKFVQRRQRPRITEPEPVPAAATAPINTAAKPTWNFDTDGPRATSSATTEKKWARQWFVHEVRQ